MRSITAATLILVAGCRGGAFGPRGSLSYAQYNSLEEGMGPGAVIAAFGKPTDTLERDGRVRGLGYRCQNARGIVVALRMVFDERGRLTKWTLHESA